MFFFQRKNSSSLGFLGGPEHQDDMDDMFFQFGLIPGTLGMTGINEFLAVLGPVTQLRLCQMRENLGNTPVSQL